MVAKNVIITSFRLSAIGWFSGILSEIHEAIYDIPIKWNYEISRFECTRVRRPLPQGWCTVWEANPLILANRGFDKILVVKRPLKDILEACSWYSLQKGCEEACKDKENKRFFDTIKRKYHKLYDIEYNNKRVYYANIEDLNRNPVQEFKKICEFLGFKMSKFPVLIPIKVKKDWEVYAGYNKGLELDKQLTLLKEARSNE